MQTTDFATMKATDLRELVKNTPGALDALTEPVSRAKKDALVAALEAATEDEPKPRKVGNRSFTDEQAAETVRLRHEELLSWRQIAKAQGYGTPGVARRAYRHATGCEGVLPRIAGKSGRPTAGMVAGTEKPQILGAAPTDEPA